MSFIQKFFTGRGNYADGDARIGEMDRLWYDSATNTIRIGDGTPGGKIVSGSGLGSNVHEGPTPPTIPSPVAGDLWWDTTDGRMYIYFDSNWVDSSPLGGSLFNLTAGTGITFSSGTTYNGSAAITINSTAYGVDTFSETVTTQASTLTVDFAGVSTIFWQPSATGNRTVTLSGFTAGRRVKIFITPKAGANTFTFTGVTASQCSNNSITFVLGGGGTAQTSMMIELFSTTTAIGGVWIFGYGSQ